MNRRLKEIWKRWNKYSRYRVRVEVEARAAMRDWLMV